MYKPIDILIESNDPALLRSLKVTLTEKKDANTILHVSDIETHLGAEDSISLLKLGVEFLTGAAAQIAAAWIYDLFKKKHDAPVFHIYINSIKITNEAEIKSAIENGINKDTQQSEQ